ncbi:alpha-N-acetylgalactosaminidase isoform X1 [Chiloscyllium plagiosum]|uniref:alpha-N-acetylgalactosaminidase isoform X1 n=1 Tax=Chiloscyllium plagiosum TaxID=36176 RepID=UPI001CB84DC9|nr:alpha-N-acetylgalactosaminidase isoform X1 [Chiloscyllium plagiosum]
MKILPIFLVILLSSCGHSLDNGLMRTPPMGWLAWERFRCNTDCDNDPENCISERLFMDMADRLAEDGWKELGYQYVNIDDCWAAKERDSEGRLVADPIRFPSGIKALAEYVHAKGLKLGIYGDLGTYTCGGYPGTTLDQIELDAHTFASWGVDMLKLDGCYSNSSTKALGYPLMSKALNATGRPIAFSCSWPAYEGGLPPLVNYTLLGEICNLWRNYADIDDSWESVRGIINWYSRHQDVLQPVAGPGKWNDPDMLIIGNFGLSYEQSKSQMALWAILAAPLFMSNDLRAITLKEASILQNKLLIRISQDPLGVQGQMLLKGKNNIEVWMRQLSSSTMALAFFSQRTDMPYHYTTSLGQLNITAPQLFSMQDVYSGRVLHQLEIDTKFTVTINPSGVVMLFVYPEMQLVQDWDKRRPEFSLLKL